MVNLIHFNTLFIFGNEEKRIREIKERYGISPGILLVQGYYYGKPEIIE